eukprot:5627988-Prymnesium_polylepis.1
MRNFGRKREPTEPSHTARAAAPDTFRGGLPGTFRPEHPSLTPEDRPAPCAHVLPTQQHSTSSHTHARDARTPCGRGRTEPQAVPASSAIKPTAAGGPQSRVALDHRLTAHHRP